MNYARAKKVSHYLAGAGTLICLVLLPFAFSRADESFSFDLDEFEKKTFEWGGYFEGKWEHIKINQGSAFSSLNLPEDVDSSLDRLTGSLLVSGNYNRGIAGFNWRLKASGQQDELGWSDMVDIYEAYASIDPTSRITFSVGKKTYIWGKGYAWNPVGFINRRKDPNNPDEALEGFSTVEVDMIKSFHGALQNIGFTAAILPVWDSINEDFGRANYINLATN